MHSSEAISILNYAFDIPCFSAMGSGNCFRTSRFKNNIHGLRIQAYFVLQVVLFEFCPHPPPQKMGPFLEISIAEEYTSARVMDMFTTALATSA